MGMPLGIKYDYKALAKDFFKDIVENNSLNSELYYRFETFQLQDYIAIKTDNNSKDLDGDLPRIVTGVLYHLKKLDLINLGIRDSTNA